MVYKRNKCSEGEVTKEIEIQHAAKMKILPSVSFGKTPIW